jgi:hypothetical protein
MTGEVQLNPGASRAQFLPNALSVLLIPVVLKLPSINKFPQPSIIHLFVILLMWLIQIQKVPIKRQPEHQFLFKIYLQLVLKQFFVVFHINLHPIQRGDECFIIIRVPSQYFPKKLLKVVSANQNLIQILEKGQMTLPFKLLMLVLNRKPRHPGHSPDQIFVR